MWMRHWNLARDPFSGRDAPYVPTPAHAEAEARLVHAIEVAEPTSTLLAAPGLGKSVVLSRALARARDPSRRIARISGPVDGTALLTGLAEGLGVRLPAGAGRALVWKRLADAVRLGRPQGLHVVLAVDDCQHLSTPADRLDLERLAHLDPHPTARVTVVRVGRDPEPGAGPDAPAWGLAIRLRPLTRSDAERFVTTKLAAAGRDEPAFTPRAITRLHALSAGIPRGLDRLASLALMAGAMRRLEVIPPEVIEGVALECWGHPASPTLPTADASG
jgi:type II secretory pathway predicted ATPase ExeA